VYSGREGPENRYYQPKAIYIVVNENMGIDKERKTAMMKKRIKKLLSLAVSVVMVAAMTITASADNDTLKTITIDGNTTGHTYVAYQLFSGTADGNGASDENQKKIVGTPKWTTNVTEEEVKAFVRDIKADSTLSTIFAGVTEDSAYGTDGDASTFASAMSGLNNGSSFQKNAFTAIAVKYFCKSEYTSYTSVEGAANADGKIVYTISDVPQGYYLIRDTASDADGDVASRILATVVNDVEITSVKEETTTLEKTVENDTKKGVSASVGDEVDFQLVADFPEYVSTYKSYELVFKDTLPAGLTFDRIISVKIVDDGSGTEKATLPATNFTSYPYTDGYKLNSSANSFRLEIGNLMECTAQTTTQGTLVKDLMKGTSAGQNKLVVKYATIVNGNAKSGNNEKNENVATLAYTNDPYADAVGDLDNNDPGGETPEQKAEVFTYQIQINKTDATTGDALDGAEFKIYKEVNNVKKYYTTNANNGTVSWEESSEGADIFTTDSEGKVNLPHLEAGTFYYLIETKAPRSWYNLTNQPIGVEIKETIDQTTGSVTAVSAYYADVDHAGDPATGVVTVGITNGTGSELPETGGMGRTIVYVLGAALAVGAAILLVVRKRMSMER
jgi:fimbrial isopeptide formation D2 family protein/LPXTG-motif cell wall-anchored protein